MPQKHVISKSSFIKGKQCLKSLYLSKKHSDLRDKISEGQQAVFDIGKYVGEVAKQLFPGGVMAACDLPEGFYRSMKYTKEIIEKGQNIIYEAGFTFETTHCFVDILVKEDGKWNIYEVKSSTEVKDVHIFDVAFQYYVINNLGLEINDVSIIYINSQYVRIGEIDIQQLFTVESVIEQVLENQAVVKNLLMSELITLQKTVVPDIGIGPHCFDPYDCDFMGFCWKDVPEYSIFNISNLRKNKKFDLYNKGILETTDIPFDYPLNANQLLQVQADKTGETIIDKPGIKKFLESLNYPLYFLDFETFNPAIPLYNYSRPYQQIVFQYSLHILNEPGGQIEHRDFLAQPKGDPRITMIEQLINEIGSDGNIIVYNKGFETPRLNEIARDFLKYESKIKKILDRIVDLMIPFQQKLYYTPEMKGLYSIKQVLPALVPGFSYKNLEINNGGDASLAFVRLMKENDPAMINQTRQDLLKYCKMDTLAMVEILKVLNQVYY
jgi:hypothetical protein